MVDSRDWRDLPGGGMGLSAAELSLIEQRIANEAPSLGVAYFLWLFLGLFSAHRFYVGRTGSAVAQIASYFILIGFVWLLLDAALIPGMVRDRREAIRQRITTDMLTNSRPASDLPSADAAAIPAGAR